MNVGVRQGGEFYARLPKVHLHTHILGMVRPETVIELAGRNGVDIGTVDAQTLYDYYDFRDFVSLLAKVAAVMRTEDDFSRVMYEAIADDYHQSRVLYAEIFIQTAIHRLFGVPYERVIAGFVDGVRRAEEEFGITVRLIEGINRSLPAFHAVETVRALLACKSPYFIGVGLEDFEVAGPPELFAEAFALVRMAGLRCTAHAGEHGPAANIVTCLSTLGCARIDHGYQAVTDPSIFYRLGDNKVHFTVCPTVSSRQGWSQPDGHVIKKMYDAGMWLSINADDGAVIRSSLAHEYQLASRFIGLDESAMARLSLGSIEASWLPAEEKARLQKRFTKEFSQIPELANVDFS